MHHHDRQRAAIRRELQAMRDAAMSRKQDALLMLACASALVGVLVYALSRYL